MGHPIPSIPGSNLGAHQFISWFLPSRLDRSHQFRGFLSESLHLSASGKGKQGGMGGLDDSHVINQIQCSRSESNKGVGCLGPLPATHA